MILNRLSIAIVLMALFAPNAFAQANQNGDDQPGLIANADDERLDPKWQRTVVFYRTTEPPGTIIVASNERYLYVVQPGGRALRYGIGVGRDGFRWQGLVKITQKKEWPDWTPPRRDDRSASPICRAGWPAAPAIRSARARSISATRSIAFTAPTSRRPSAPRCRPAASA